MNKQLLPLSILVYLLPLFLISGPLLSDISISILALYVVYRFFFLKDIFIDKRIIFLLLAFWFLLMLSTSLSGYFFETYKSSFFYFRFGFYAFAIAYFSIKIKEFNTIMLIFLIIILSFLVLDSIAQYITKFNYLFNKSLDDPKRISSFFGDEKILGGYLVHIIPVVVYLMFKKNIEVIYIFIFYTFASIGIFISGERTSVLLFFLMTIIFIYFLNINLKSKIIGIFILATIYFVTVSYSSNLTERLTSQTFNEIFEIDKDGKTQFYYFSKGHTLLYLTSIDMFLDNSIIGVGPKVFRYLCADPMYINSIDDMIGCSTHPHNYYIQMLAELGIIGFLFLLSIFIYFVKKIFTNQIDNCKLSICVSMIIGLFPFSPDGNFFNNWISILAYFPLGFYIAEYNLVSNEK